MPSVGSPPSAAPSPLPCPHSVPEGPGEGQGEPPMPTLSPHVPAQPDKPEEGERSVGQAEQPSPKKEEGCGGSGSLKRPVLTSKEYENALLEEEQTLDLLYDYSTLEAW